MKARVFGDVIPSSLTAIFWRHPQAPSSEQKVKAAEGTKTLLHTQDVSGGIVNIFGGGSMDYSRVNKFI
jgi:succinyl-CoA synthetase beta subunit